MGVYTGSGPTDPVVGNKTSVTNFGVPTADAIQALASTYTAYTPTWTSSGTAPAIGNGTITGGYTQVGKLVVFFANLTTGSTTTFGTGAYSVSLPVTAATGPTQILACEAFDTSTGFYYRGVSRIDSGSANVTRTHFVDGVTGPSGWTPAVPFTWAVSGDQFFVSGSYFAA